MNKEQIEKLSEEAATMELINIAKSDKEAGRVCSSSEFKAKLAKRKEAAKREKQ